jgi:hypothetical protein
MGRYHSHSLLILAGLFEHRALKALAQFASYPEGMERSFAEAIIDRTHTSPTTEQWKSWLDANRTVLGDLSRKRWDWNGRVMSHQMSWNDQTGESVYAYITIDHNPPTPQFEESQTSVLRASPPIPTLWFWVGQNHYRPEPIPAELAHDAWLLGALRESFGANQENAASFIIDNRSLIDKLRRSFKTANPIRLGAGSDGTVFDIGGDRILKIFRDDVSYQKAKDAFDRLHKNPALSKTEAMLYDVGTLGQVGGTHVYYYIMEKMRPLLDHTDYDARAITDNISNILNFVVDRLEQEKNSKWRKLKLLIADPTKAEIIKTEVKKRASQLADIYANEYSDQVDYIEGGIGSLKPNWLPLYIEEIIMKYLTGRTDLHMGNIGVTSYGELRYFDPAYEGWSSNING